MYLVRPSLLLACALVLGAGTATLPAQVQPALQKASMMFPASTRSEAARDHSAIGQRALDVGRVAEAREHFRQAVAADPTFAYGYLQLANTSTSIAEYKTELDRAVQHAEAAGQTEQLLIRIARAGLDGDVEQQLQLAQELTRVEPENPRSWLALAEVQTARGNEAEARTAMRKAAEMAPDFVVAHVQLANSFLLTEPRDAAEAAQHARRVVDMEPNEASAHDLMGDAYRAQGKLQEAGEAYSRAAELEPANGLLLQQRGHVHSLLGRYDAARTDYDAAARLGRDNEKATFPVWRALVSVHAGDASAAIAELDQLVPSIDAMNVPDPTGSKILALSELATIALHTGNLEAAERAITQLSGLHQREAESVGTPEFRRTREAEMGFWEGMLALRRGEPAEAKTRAATMITLRQADRSPRKNERAHQLLGMVELTQKNYAEAAAHFQKADPNDIYATYHHALALEGAGRKAEAKKLFREVANFNFNNAGLALVRREATKKAQ